VSNKFVLFLVIVFLCLTQCTHRVRTETVQNKISIIYINNLQYDQAPQITTLIKNEQKINPLLVITNANIFSNSPFSDLNKGFGEIELLNHCDFDAVLLTPGSLKYGIPHLKELIRKSSFSYLGANIKDKNTGQTLGQEYLFKTIRNTRIAIFGISYDSADFYFQDRNLEFRNPDFSIMKLLPLIKERSDFQFILTRTQDSLDLPDNLVFGAPVKNQDQLLPINQNGIFKIEISFDNMKNITEIKRTTVSLDTISPDPVAESIITKYQAKNDSVFKKRLAIIDRGEEAIKILLAETKTLSFLSDALLISGRNDFADVFFTDLYNWLRQKNVLPIIAVQGKELRKFAKTLYPPINKISDDKGYLILSTTDFLARHPELKYEQIEFTTSTVWEILINNLK